MKPRLLAIELHHLGDAVMAIPFLRAAGERFTVGVFCTPPVAAMVQSFLPGIETFPAREGWTPRLLQAASALKKWGPDVTVSAWSDARAHLVARLSGAGRRLGFPMNGINYYAPQIPWRKRRLAQGASLEQFARSIGQPLLTEPLQRENARESHLANWQRLAAALELNLPLDPPWFDVSSLTPPENLPSFLEEQKRAGRPIWALHAGGRLATKRWPLERFDQLLRDFFAPRNLPVLILGSPGEPTPSPASDLQRVWPCSSHRELAALINGADALLCNDSYPAHLGAALGKRVYAIFGSGEPAWFSAHGNAHRVIRKSVCPHHPCIDRCVLPSTICLEAVGVGDVAGFLERSEAP